MQHVHRFRSFPEISGENPGKKFQIQDGIDKIPKII